MKKQLTLVVLLLCFMLSFAVACGNASDKKTYNVTYSCDADGAISDEAFTYTEGAEKVEIPVTLKEGYSESNITVTYTMGGETKTATLSNGKFAVESPDGDIAVSVTGAKLNEYKVDFVVGTEVKYTLNVKHGESLTVPQLNSAKAAVTGTDGENEFVKWTESTDGIITADTVIHAEIRRVVFEVRFRLGGEIVHTAKVREGQKLTAEQLAEAEEQVKAAIDLGHRFDGWQTSTDVEITADTEIVAKTRELNKYQVRIKENIEGALIKTDVETDEAVEDESYIFSLEFASAYTKSAGKVTVTYSIGGGEAQMLTMEDGVYTIAKVTGNVVIEVTGIEINKYTVKFANGEETKSEIIVTHGERITEEQLTTALATIANDNQEAWGWKDETGAEITADTTIHAVIANAISTKEQMLVIEQEGNYYLTADIDMGDELAVVWGNVVWTADPETCGDAKNGEYRGIFDGRGKTLTYTHTSEVPYDTGLLFYRLKGTVKNLKINATLNNNFNANCNTLGVVTMQLADGIIKDVEVTLNAAGMVNQPNVGVGAICSNLFGGTIDNCTVNFAALPTYNFANDKVAPVAAVKSWEKPEGGERTKVLIGLSVRLPENVQSIAAYLTYLTMDEMTGDYEPEIATVEPSFELDKDNEILWESTDYKKAIAASTEEQSAAPRGFEKVYKSDGTYNDDNQGSAFIIDEKLDRYIKVAFALKTDNRNLCDSGWGNPLDKETWYVFYAEKTDGKWTLTVHEKTLNGTVKFTYADLAVSSLTDLYRYYNYNGDPTHIWATEVRYVADPDYAEMVETQLMDATLIDGTLSETLAVDGYNAVYTRDSFSFSAWSEIDISEYDYVTFKTDYRGWYLPNPSWADAFDCSTWVEWKLTNNNDGTWTITFTHDGTSIDHVNTFSGTKLNEVLNILFLSPKTGESETFAVTNLIGYKAK